MKFGQDYNLQSHICHMWLAENRNSMCTYFMKVFLHWNVENKKFKKSKKMLTLISKHRICPLHSLNGICWEDSVITIQNILSNDMTSECFMFCTHHLISFVKGVHLLLPPLQIGRDLTACVTPGLHLWIWFYNPYSPNVTVEQHRISAPMALLSDESSRGGN